MQGYTALLMIWERDTDQTFLQGNTALLLVQRMVAGLLMTLQGDTALSIYYMYTALVVARRLYILISLQGNTALMMT